MWRRAWGWVGEAGPAVEDAPDVAWGEALAPPVEEDGVVRAVSAADQVGRDRRRSQAASAAAAGSLSGTWRCLEPLPHTRTVPRVEVEVVGPQAAQLADPQAAAVEQLEHRVVAQADGRRVGVDRRRRVVEQHGQLVVAQHARAAARRPTGADSPAEGSTATRPERRSQPKYRRSADALRATVRRA